MEQFIGCDAHKKFSVLVTVRRMALTNKTDKLDARGLAILLRNGTLPKCGFPGAS